MPHASPLAPAFMPRNSILGAEHVATHTVQHPSLKSRLICAFCCCCLVAFNVSFHHIIIQLSSWPPFPDHSRPSQCWVVASYRCHRWWYARVPEAACMPAALLHVIHSLSHHTTTTVQYMLSPSSHQLSNSPHSLDCAAGLISRLAYDGVLTGTRTYTLLAACLCFLVVCYSKAESFLDCAANAHALKGGRQTRVLFFLLVMLQSSTTALLARLEFSSTTSPPAVRKCSCGK